MARSIGSSPIFGTGERAEARWHLPCALLACLIAIPVLPTEAFGHPGSPPDYWITERDAASDFDAPVARVEDLTFDTLAGQWCFVNDAPAAFGCTDPAGAPTQNLSRSIFETYLVAEGVANPQLYVGETELVAHDAQSDHLYVANNVSIVAKCDHPGTGVEDLPALFRLTRNSPQTNWVISAHWLLPSMNDCPPYPPLVFRYVGLMVVDGVVFFHTDRSFTSAGGEPVVRGIYEFDLSQNLFVDLNAPAFAYDTSNGFLQPRRLEYDARENQVYVTEYSTSSPDEVRLLQIDWSSRTAVKESDLSSFAEDPPESGFLHATRGVGVDSASKRMRLGNNDSTSPNSLAFAMRLAHHQVPAMGPLALGVLCVLLCTTQSVVANWFSPARRA